MFRELTSLSNAAVISRHHLVLDDRREPSVGFPLEFLRQPYDDIPNVRDALRVRLELLSQHAQAIVVVVTLPCSLRDLAMKRLEVRPDRPDEAIHAGR
jgi:hypothetical protein